MADFFGSTYGRVKFSSVFALQLTGLRRDEGLSAVASVLTVIWLVDVGDSSVNSREHPEYPGEVWIVDVPGGLHLTYEEVDGVIHLLTLDRE